MNSTAQWHAYEAIMAGVFPNQSLDIVKSEPFEALTERLTPYNPECWKKTRNDTTRAVNERCLGPNIAGEL